MKIVARQFFRTLPIVPLFRCFHRVTADDLRQLLDGALAGRSGDGEDSQDFLDQLFFKGGILTVCLKNSLKLRSHSNLLESKVLTLIN